MPNPKQYIFAVQLEEPERFREIFGETIAELANSDLARGIERIAETVLQLYRIDVGVASPGFGCWYVLFAVKTSLLQADMMEQSEVLCEVGRARIRELLIASFGEATGSRQAFSVVIAVAPESLSPEALTKAISSAQASTSSNAVFDHGVSRDQVLDIIMQGRHETYLQPIVALPGETVAGYEALSRGPLDSPLHGAERLFSAARHYGLTRELEFTCLKRAICCLPKIPQDYWIAVNLGPDLFCSGEFHDYLAQLSTQGLLPRIVFELTEHLPVESATELQDAICRLSTARIRLSLDDTGCGFFDLTTVAALRPEIVKLCITVISRIGRSPDVETEMRNTITEISRLGAQTLGEGVESRYQAEILKQCGASLAQGNFFAVPEPAAVVLQR